MPPAELGAQAGRRKLGVSAMLEHRARRRARTERAESAEVEIQVGVR